jgi:plasmid maintenance system killer protein
MKIKFLHNDHERLGVDSNYDAGLPGDVVSSYRKRLAFIECAYEEGDFYAIKSLRLKKLTGENNMEHSISLIREWYLIIKFDKNDKSVVVISITDQEAKHGRS